MHANRKRFGEKNCKIKRAFPPSNMKLLLLDPIPYRVFNEIACGHVLVRSEGARCKADSTHIVAVNFCRGLWITNVSVQKNNSVYSFSNRGHDDWNNCTER